MEQPAGSRFSIRTYIHPPPNNCCLDSLLVVANGKKKRHMISTEVIL